jgi:hypothetical protein
MNEKNDELMNQESDVELIIEPNDGKPIQEISTLESKNVEENLGESVMRTDMNHIENEADYVTNKSDDVVEKSITHQEACANKSKDIHIKLHDTESTFSTFPPNDTVSNIESNACNFELEDDQVVENTITTINPNLINLLLDNDEPDKEINTIKSEHSDPANDVYNEILEELTEEPHSDHDEDECEAIEEEFGLDESSPEVLTEDALSENVSEATKEEDIQAKKQISDITLCTSSDEIDVREDNLADDNKCQIDIEEAWETDDEDIKEEKKLKHRRKSFTYVARKYPRKKSSNFQEFDQAENRISISLSSMITAKSQEENLKESENVLITNESKSAEALEASPPEAHGLVFYPIDDPFETKHLGRTFSRISQRAVSSTSNRTAQKETKNKVWLILKFQGNSRPLF